MIHYSKKDWWLMAILCAAVIGMSVGGFSILIAGSEPAWVGIVLLASAAIIVSLIGTISYEITSTELIIRCAVFRFSVPVDEIQEIFPTHNPLSSPALSLDRLRINYLRNGKKKFVMISPQDKTAFLNELVEVAEQLTVSNDRVERQTNPT